MKPHLESNIKSWAPQEQVVKMELVKRTDDAREPKT